MNRVTRLGCHLRLQIGAYGWRPQSSSTEVSGAVVEGASPYWALANVRSSSARWAETLASSP